MSAHTGRVFLNSCLKVPIDPCNNCPAPIYNRPRMYLGRLSSTPFGTSGKMTTATTFKTTATETPLWASNGIRSLAKFYDSIPDYSDINHLPTEEFYSTLDTLRTTCRQLKTKSSNSYVQVEVDSSQTPSSETSLCALERGANCKKGPRKKSTVSKTKWRKKTGHHKGEDKSITPTLPDPQRHTETGGCAVDAEHIDNIVEKAKLKSVKEELKDEVEAFKTTLKDFEKELKRPVSSSMLCRTKRTSLYGNMDASSEIERNSREDSYKVPVDTSFNSLKYNSLKKSHSFNDIHAISELSVKDGGTNSRFEKLTKAEALLFKDPAKLSNYFNPSVDKIGTKERDKTTNSELPKIILESPISEATSWAGCRRKKLKSRKSSDQVEVPFTLFNMADKKKENIEQCSPSPLHPVARPNLAATLRVAVSKKKIKDLEIGCSMNTTASLTPQIDWEVRKTPAWKSLALNESHKDILSLRLATRKAEQALQQRQYELHMEMMRQRVKSAPLLLEGTTYWGPTVGKLTHTCNKATQDQSCQSARRKHRKKCTARSRGGGSDCGSDTYFGTVDYISRKSSKINSLRKIYGSSVKAYSRSSRRSSNSDRVEKNQRGKSNQPLSESADDDLSSLDRAFL